MGKTIAEKILARASGNYEVSAGETVKANVDLAMMPDLTTILALNAMNEIGRDNVWDNEKVVIVLDHVAPASTLNAATIHRDIRRFAKKQNLKYLYGVESGVCHQVLEDEGHVRPGMLIIGADSHTCTHGALGAFATGVGSTDMGGVLATGKIWLQVPETILVNVDGRLPDLVLPKDVVLHIAGTVGNDGATYNAIEFAGPTVSDMSVSGRMTLCNMAIEMGGKAGIVAPDDKTVEFLRDKTDEAYTAVEADPDANYKRGFDIDVSDLEPQIACPHLVDNVKPVSQVSGTRIDQVFIGSCTNGRFEDLEVAARILKGRHIHPDVRLLVVPASYSVYQKALDEGVIETLFRAGAMINSPSCGACFGGHIGLLAAEEVSLTTSNRNFKGRQGSPEAEVYLSSPAVAAASSTTGVITDPRDLK